MNHKVKEDNPSAIPSAEIETNSTLDADCECYVDMPYSANRSIVYCPLHAAERTRRYYCPEHKYTAPDNSGFAFCPHCEMASAPVLKRRFKIFDGMTWPTPDAELEWRLRYAPESVTTQDEMYLASVLSAYQELISCNRNKREKVARELRTSATGDQKATPQQSGVLAESESAAPVLLDDERLIEKLAALSHDQWSQWMRYMFEQCAYDGNLVSIPANCFHRWQRQMRTPYAKLPESEKETDRIEARKVLSLLSAPVAQWQPIETAPKDGSQVVLFWLGYGNGVTVGFYLDNSHTAHPWQGWRVFSGQIARYGQPTHWMPLPSAPVGD